jgi:arylsulfatase A-like enzyme
MNPEDLRIPLIIHLPEKMKSTYYHDPDQIAFNIDITPTLYYLLGHGPVVNDPRFGRPLFTKTPKEAEAYRRDSYLVVNTYTPIYGLLSNNGKSLFIANPLDYTNGYFDLEKDPFGVVNRLNDKILITDQELIHDDVQQIGKLYHFELHEPTFMEWLTH